MTKPTPEQVEFIKQKAIELYKKNTFKGKPYKNCIGSVNKVINELLNPVMKELK